MDKRKDMPKAVALQYDPLSDAAPMVSAVGQGQVAERIIQQARENDVPVVEDKSVAEVLAQFSVGDQIPPSLYDAVAQILIFISEMDR